MNSEYWYLATPYRKYPNGLDIAFEHAKQQTVLLLDAGISVYSPIVHNHNLFETIGRGHDYSFWLDIVDRPLMRGACGTIVCMLPTWDESTGVGREIQYFQSVDKPIVYMEPGLIPVLPEIRRHSEALNDLANRCHAANITWWQDLETGRPIQRNKGELLMLIESEVAEAMEGARKNLQDDKLVDRKMEEVELADALVRIFDYAGGFGLDLGGAFEEKMDYNAQRADHKPEHRLAEGGKRW